MARKKVRKYDSIDKVEFLLRTYFITKKQEVIDALLKQYGFESVDDLHEAEYKKFFFGFDCGFVYVETKNKEQLHEWELDNDKWSAKVYEYKLNIPYYSQSTSAKMFQLRYALEQLDLTEQYFASMRLD